ncbi:ElyC/SanA/YdcF family protein [Motilimonas sp. KMU-193]|uniref:ElyC/SanA/YdcF family protein n=1 Tax=Motilimonas sp. KMU-193 TaxID=3388668 RepID=UPI00396B1ADB
MLKPVPFSLTLITLGLLLLLFSRKQKLGKCVAASGLICFALFASEPFSGYLVANLERQYPAFNTEQNVDMILVLGSYGLADPDLAITGQLSNTALARFSEAFRIWRASPNATWVVSGSGFGDSHSHAQLMAQLAITYGVPEQQIIRLNDTKDTPQEAAEMAQLMTGKTAALVTSATHMPRAKALFDFHQVSPIAAPASYHQRNSTQAEPLTRQIPSAYYLYRSEVAMHEYMGIWWAKLRQLTR